MKEAMLMLFLFLAEKIQLNILKHGTIQRESAMEVNGLQRQDKENSVNHCMGTA